MLANLRQVFRNIKLDFDRYTGKSNNPLIIIAKMAHNPGMIFSVLYRFERYLLYESNILFKILGFILYPIYFVFTYYFLMYHIEPRVKIAGGLLLHNMDIVITDLTTIGKNFSIMGQTTIGTDFGSPTVSIEIGDNVKIGTGARIIAKGILKISDNVVIGANSVVTKSITDKGTIYAGIPARYISKNNYKD